MLNQSPFCSFSGTCCIADDILGGAGGAAEGGAAGVAGDEGDVEAAPLGLLLFCLGLEVGVLGEEAADGERDVAKADLAGGGWRRG